MKLLKSCGDSPEKIYTTNGTTREAEVGVLGGEILNLVNRGDLKNLSCLSKLSE